MPHDALIDFDDLILLNNLSGKKGIGSITRRDFAKSAKIDSNITKFARIRKSLFIYLSLPTKGRVEERFSKVSLITALGCNWVFEYRKDKQAFSRSLFSGISTYFEGYDRFVKVPFQPSPAAQKFQIYWLLL